MNTKTTRRSMEIFYKSCMDLEELLLTENLVKKPLFLAKAVGKDDAWFANHCSPWYTTYCRPNETERSYQYFSTVAECMWGEHGSVSLAEATSLWDRNDQGLILGPDNKNAYLVRMGISDLTFFVLAPFFRGNSSYDARHGAARTLVDECLNKWGVKRNSQYE